MRKNIIISAVLVLFVGMTSCSGWLDVKPKKTVEEEELFSREIGFKEALTAAYIKMANTNLYAKNLSYGFIDILGQRYENGKGTDTYQDELYYTFPSKKTEEFTSVIWGKMYNIIADLNNLLYWVDKNKTVFTTPDYYEIIKGEALGLRAFLHFDLLRMYGPIYKEHPDTGHRRIRDDLEKDYNICTSNKRVLHFCRVLHIQSTVKFRKQGCTKNASDPQVTAQNLLHREFWAGRPNEKWLTDVTEFKWYEGPIIHKLYLSPILDLCDRRIVSYVIRDRNDNKLVFDTLDKAVLENPDAHPLFHSDRGFQYTSRTFHKKLLDAGMTQSMSRVGRCIDNGPMEGFWGILKRECYYGQTFTSREQLVSAIEDYIDYYNNRRYQHRLFIQTPMQAHVSAMNRAA